ncbi:uncharacterized protein (DUF58 family) [Motilibacter rhizosphaerae]|uniref:Uncharacterized protein (DUF58 family) n=1 Tax=Motilibacter rhizosphaerae TaxID=598652 RepID=A0A4Q7NGJ0_9ACTN|nr:DUF58 domain-containing protein [Motilibacter rhizosphaerae]RZS82929.1 uncharacterized protein (DUF58 family) [Motilibacter rhizosphaerae]
MGSLRRLLRIVRGSLSGLTTRGRSFLAAGVAAALTAVVLGQSSILRVGVLLAVVPLLGASAVTRSQYRLACTRRVEPARVPAGETAVVTLRLDNVSRIHTGVLLAEDRVPYVLGSRPRFVLDRVEPQGQRAVGYQVRSEVRGRFVLGPLGVRLSDPFGMCELHRSFAATDTLVVTPVVVPLPVLPLEGSLSGSGTSSARSVAAAGEDDVSTREYRHGDALHRVHWRSTARRGELMVRREEQPWQSRATLLLDGRAACHAGEGPSSSYERAVSAIASVGVHLATRGYALTLVLPDLDGAAAVSPVAAHAGVRGEEAAAALLDRLAVLDPAPQPELRLSALDGRGAADALLVAVVADLTSAEAAELSRATGTSGRRRSCLALVLDTATWRPGATVQPGAPGSGAAATAALLRAAGWRTAVLGATTPLPEAWALLVGGVGSAAAAGAAAAGTYAREGGAA